MSINVLNNPRTVHRVSDDLESVLWVLIWTIIRYVKNASTPDQRRNHLNMLENTPTLPADRKELFLQASSFGGAAMMLKLQEPPGLVQLIDLLFSGLRAQYYPELASFDPQQPFDNHDWMLDMLNDALNDPAWQKLRDGSIQQEVSKISYIAVARAGTTSKRKSDAMDSREDAKKRRVDDHEPGPVDGTIDDPDPERYDQDDGLGGGVQEDADGDGEEVDEDELEEEEAGDG